MADLIGLRLGNYEIIRLLGEGGMATVYRAHQITMARDVAIKVIKTSELKAGEFSRRFQREARTVAALNHPHILKVFDFGEQNDLAYLVMELQPGGSLAELIAAGPLSLARTTRILDQVGSALDYAHRQGLVHRDLKPQNILFDSDGNAILSDFGIAKLLGNNENTALTQAGVVVGTPIYMAPELWQGDEVDSRADLYALGVVLFQMLSGKIPFSGDTPYNMMHKHIYELPPSVVQFRPELSPMVDTVIQTVLAKDRNQRYDTAQTLGQAFKTALNSPASMVLNAPVSPVVPPMIVPAVIQQTTAQNPAAASSAKRSIPVTLVIGIVVGIMFLFGLVGGGMLLATRPTPPPGPTMAVAVLLTPTTVTVAINSTNNTVPTATVNTATVTRSATATVTPKPTNSAVPTNIIPTSTTVPKPTVTSRDSALLLQTALALAFTQTAAQWTPTSVPTRTQTLTATPSLTSTSAPTATATDYLVGTAVRLLTTTAIVQIAAINTQKAQPTATATPSVTNTPSLSPTARPSTTPSETVTRTASYTASPKPTSTPTNTLFPTSSNTAPPTETPVPSKTSTPQPTETPVPSSTSTSTPQPSATPVPSKTSTPVATNTASTAIPGTHFPLDVLAMTVTARAEGTPGAGATDTPFYNGDPLLPPTMKVAFSDSFYDNSSNWTVYSKPDVGTVQIANNLLQFALKPSAIMTIMAPANAPVVTDFYFRTLVSYNAPPLWSTTSFGVVIHRSDAGYDFIDIRPGSCIFALNSFNAKTNTVTTISVKNGCQIGSPLKTLQSFVLTVIGSGNQFTVYVNNTKEVVLTDTAKNYSSGSLGVYAISSQTSGFNVAFTDIAIGQ